MARLRADVTVGAVLRTAFAAGATALVQRRGEAEAGSVLVLVDRLDGTGALYGPAPMSAVEGRDDARAFARLHDEEALPLADLERRAASQARSDPDLWVVAVEDRQGRPFAPLG